MVKVTRSIQSGGRREKFTNDKDNPRGGSVNTNADVILLQRFAKYYSVKVWKNTQLFIPRDV